MSLITRAQNVILKLNDGREIMGTFREFVKEGEEFAVVGVTATLPFDLPAGFEWAEFPPKAPPEDGK